MIYSWNPQDIYMRHIVYASIVSELKFVGSVNVQGYIVSKGVDKLEPKNPLFTMLCYSTSCYSVIHSCITFRNPMDCSMPGFPIQHQPPELAQTHVHQVGDGINHLILCYLLLLLPSIFPSISGFSNELALHIRWPKYWSFSFSISPSNEYSGLIYFRMDWLDLLSVQGTLKSLLQHHSSKASILQHSAFSVVHLSHSYMTTGKTIALTRWTFVSIVMSLFPGISDGKKSACWCRSPRFNPWVGKIPWRREWKPTSVFLSGEFHGWRSLMG